MADLVSVIVPVYGVAAQLPRCLDSLLAQTCGNMEIIAVDDCSTDSSFEILQEYARRYPDKLYVCRHERNKKQGGARNTGLFYAKGEWVGFIDSDDWLSDDEVF